MTMFSYILNISLKHTHISQSCSVSHVRMACATVKMTPLQIILNFPFVV